MKGNILRIPRFFGRYWECEERFCLYCICSVAVGRKALADGRNARYLVSFEGMNEASARRSAVVGIRNNEGVQLVLVEEVIL